jgi:GTPase KRas protein
MSDYRVVVLGESGVGKSSVVIFFILNKFTEYYDPTIEDTYRKIIMVDDQPCVLNIIDTAGADEYTTMRDQHLIRGQAFILLYDITNYESFEGIQRICEKLYRAKDMDSVVSVRRISNRTQSDRTLTPIRRSSSATSISSTRHTRKQSMPNIPNISDSDWNGVISARTQPIPLVLVGNKSDLREHRKVSYKDGHDLAKKYGCPFYEVSARSSDNIYPMFHQLVREIRQYIPQVPNDKSEDKNFSKKCLIL